MSGYRIWAWASRTVDEYTKIKDDPKQIARRRHFGQKSVKTRKQDGLEKI